MNEAIKSNILTLVLTNHASGDISHGNIYKIAFYPSVCTPYDHETNCSYVLPGMQKRTFRSFKYSFKV